MPYARLIDYHNSISMIQAEKAMMEIGVVSYPHMKQDKQKEFRKKLERWASEKLDSFSTSAPRNTEELYHSIMGQLSGR